jgi:secreted trypsin-like serine protease
MAVPILIMPESAGIYTRITTYVGWIQTTQTSNPG